MENWKRSELVVVPVVTLLLFCIFRCSNAATDPNDAAALRVMYSSLNSPAQLTQWSANGDDPCGQSWKGISCSGSRVTEIKLSNLGLSGSMGYQLSSLTSVTNLDMSRNNLAGSIPYQLPPKLQQLNLAYNQFTGEVPYSISQMSSLKYLNLGHNQLQNGLGDMFQQLSSLSTFSLVMAIRGLLRRSWEVSLRHVFREGNRCADWLAAFVGSCGFGLTRLESSPSGCLSLLLRDKSGVLTPRPSV